MERFDVVVVGAGKISLDGMIGGLPRVWALSKSYNTLSQGTLSAIPDHGRANVSDY